MGVKIAVVGTGFMGDLHLSCLEKIEETEVAGIVERDEDRREKVSNRYGIDGYRDLQTLFDESDVEVVDICLPTHLHERVIEKSASHVDAIICEKPIARTLSKARSIKKTAKNKNLDLYIGHVVRFFPEYVAMKEKIESGAVGRVGVVRTFRGGASPAERSDWYADIEKSGGILVDMLIHDFDWLRWTVGEIDSVYTEGLTLGEGDRDLALVNLSFENGSLAHVEGSWAHPSHFPFTTRVEVAGEEGLINFDSSDSAPLNSYLSRRRSEKATGAPESPLARNPWCLQLEHFIECFREEKEPRVTLEDSIEALKVSLVALRSLREGDPVKVGDYNE